MSGKVIPVKVALRIRPLISKEVSEGCRECIEVVPNEPQVVIGNDKPFTFDYVFGLTSRQQELYEQVVMPLMDTYFNGYNVTVLAYGQTGSGKTYSMGTCATINTSNADDEMSNAVIPRVIQEIFTRIENLKEKSDFLVKVSFLEIHNEDINDLLNPGQPDEKGLAIRESTSGEIKINGLKEIKVSSIEEMATCLEQGSASRATGATAMNTRSSRSHAIFTIVMEQREKSSTSDVKKAKFHLVDLAGSEKAKKTQATGERFKEGVNINKGLLALGNVISALGDEQRRAHAHVPYRDSKLTRLLQDSLGGNSNTVMVACVSPADSNLEETHNTLKYADRARKIKNKPVVNRDPNAAEISKLRQQVQMLQLQLLEGQFIQQTDGVSKKLAHSEMEELLTRNKQLETENERLTSELHNAFDQTTSLYEKIMLVEMSKDRLKQRAIEVKEKIKSQGIDVSFNIDEDKDEENKDLVKCLELKMGKMEEEEGDIAPSGSVEERKSLDAGDGEHPEIANSSFAAQHALRKAELCNQLQELTKALAMKEEIASKMVDNERISSMRKQHEMTVKELEQTIENLEKEKVALNSALNKQKNSSSLKKDKERLKVLEKEISHYKKKQVEYLQTLKAKQHSDQTINKLDAEIKGMKKMKVKLMKQMKEEADKFRVWKLKKEKEINQLKQQGRKRQFEFKKLESVHLKQQAVLRRKTEEAAAANKRLKEALSKQKESLEKRNQSLHYQNKQSENVMEKIKFWLSHEIEVMVSAGEARSALKDVIEDRKALSQEVSLLKSKLQEKMGEPSCKRVSLGQGEHASQESDEICEIRKQIQALEIDLEVRSSQITELQQKIIDAEQGDRTKYRWNNIHTMAEAKAGLRSLFNWVIESKVAQGKLVKENEDCSRMSFEAGSEVEWLKSEHEQQMSLLRAVKEEEVLRSQEQVAKLLIQLQEEKAAKEEREKRLEEFTRVLSPEIEMPAKTSKERTVAAAKKHEVIVVSDTEMGSDPIHFHHGCASATHGDDEAPLKENKKPGKKSGKRSSANLHSCSCKGDCSTKRCKCRGSEKQCSSDACRCSISCKNRAKTSSPAVLSEKAVIVPADNIRTPEIGDSSGKSSAPGSASPRIANSPSWKPGRLSKPISNLGGPRRRSSKIHLHKKKKLLNTSKSMADIFTPSKVYVPPMKRLGKSSSHVKL